MNFICDCVTELLIILMTFVVICRLKHTNIVQLLDVYEDKAFKYLVMELWVIISIINIIVAGVYIFIHNDAE